MEEQYSILIGTDVILVESLLFGYSNSAHTTTYRMPCLHVISHSITLTKDTLANKGNAAWIHPHRIQGFYCVPYDSGSSELIDCCYHLLKAHHSPSFVSFVSFLVFPLQVVYVLNQ